MKAPIDVLAGEFAAERRRADGSESFWATSEGGRILTRWDLIGGKWSESSAITAASWSDAVAADTELVAIRADELTDFIAPTADTLLDLLTLAGDGDGDGDGEPDSNEWPFDLTGWEGIDDDFSFEEGQVPRFLRVNGQHAEFVLADDTAVAVLVEDGELVGGTEISEMVWNNGGDPGTGYLYAVRPGVAVGLERSDSVYKVRGFRHDTDPRGQARMMDAWLGFAAGFGTGGGAAAVALEPFDPRKTLTADQRAEWDAVLPEQRDGWDHTFRVSFDVADAVKHELRAILAGNDSRYVRVRDALEDPIQGDWLREELANGQTDSLW